MSTQTKEQAFEGTVESMLLNVGWIKGVIEVWDVNRALFAEPAIAFMRDTQPEQWNKVSQLLGDDLEPRIIEVLLKELDNKGSLHVLRHGFRFHGQTFRLAYFKPAHGLNEEALTRFERNELSVTRQALCHPNQGHTIDLLFALNGVPVATCELKNPMTNQTWKSAIRQYQQDRDPNAPLFRFQKRALVHFAADTDEVHMTTRLQREKTRFLPFNRGSNPGGIECGAGNPPDPLGYRTSYFWQEVLERERFLDIIGSYIFTETREEKVEDEKGARTVKSESVIFPRYHQLDSVNRLVATARVEGAGHNYLIQHSAGSGKTNSISWLSHRLASLHTEADEKVFDCVIVITDRRVLDRQLQDAIYQIEHAQGVVKPIDQDSRQLAEALVDGTKIVITTLQKFPFVMRGLLAVAGAESPDAPSDLDLQRQNEWRKEIAQRRYAVIVDEAHSSQSGESAREMKGVLGSRAQESLEASADGEDVLNAVVESRGPQPNLSFFAFTATPKGKTLELFGRKPAPELNPLPFHLYSMRQAIEEGFILDVLQHYIDYDAYFKLVKEAEDDPELPKRRTSTAIAKFAHLHDHNIAQKTEVIVEHFRNHVRYLMGGRAKAMVVTSSRLHAVRYMKAFKKYIAEKEYDDVRPLVAFSGTVHDLDTGEDFTEPSMNTDALTGKPISESALPARFDSSDYNVLLVAEKYQTGFDQPLLQAMYVDKRLDGVQAVQTLARLNRTAAGKQPPFVLDFVNDPEGIRSAFKPFFDQTQLLEESDPYRLEELKHELDQMQVYHWSEVEAFAQVFFGAGPGGVKSVHAQLVSLLQPTVERFRELREEGQQEFRDRLQAFVNLYAFLSQITPYGDHDHERLSAFGRALLPLVRPDREGLIDIGDDVELEFYRLTRQSSGSISVAEGPPVYVSSPTEVGTANPEEERAPLSEIIENLNDRFGTEFTEADRLFFEQIKESAVEHDRIRQTALANSLDNFKLVISPLIQHLMYERMSENDALVSRFMNEQDFQEIVLDGLVREIHEAVGTLSEGEMRKVGKLSR
ncbi:MAG: type I restriction endonuclease subunit R [Chloroflexi bacterium]|nr:type I restriction endonuclease subunit R [Chloroflexota bacterium]